MKEGEYLDSLVSEYKSLLRGSLAKNNQNSYDEKHIKEVARKKRDIPPDVKYWVSAQCEPLPALIEAAKLLFEKKPLPRIKQAESAKIPETVSRVESIANQIIKEKGRALVLITGVPGAGKTLVGLQCAHTRHLSVPPIFLSGNGPLVNVLQYELDSRSLSE